MITLFTLYTYCSKSWLDLMTMLGMSLESDQVLVSWNWTAFDLNNFLPELTNQRTVSRQHRVGSRLDARDGQDVVETRDQTIS